MAHNWQEKSFPEDDEAMDDSLHIKPPQAAVMPRNSDKHRSSSKKDHHSRKHESAGRHHEPGSSRRDRRSSHRSHHKSSRQDDTSSKGQREDQERLKREWRKKRLMYTEQQQRDKQKRGGLPLPQQQDSQIRSLPPDSAQEPRQEQQRPPPEPKEERAPPPEQSKRVIHIQPSPNEELYQHAMEDLELDPGEPLEEEDEGMDVGREEGEASEDEEMEEEQEEGEEEEEREEEATGSGTSSGSTDSEESSQSGEEADPEELPPPEAKIAEEEKAVTPPPSPDKVEVLDEIEAEVPVLPPYFPATQGCRSVEEFHCLNRIEEGTYGVVYRARDKRTNEIVALKRLKMEKEKDGFPITSLREINTLLKAQHRNIVTVREIVVGSNMDKIYIVMDYVEHDLKSLMESMKNPFLLGEVKTLMWQLLKAVAHLHDNWILHRDLKTSNLLLSHKGILKVGDFGLAREYGSPLKAYTPIVVTLWYRAPELLLGTKEYSTPIDMWSVGCIFGEFLNMKPLFPGKSEPDQLNRIFRDLGTPSDKIWPGYGELPLVKKLQLPEFPSNIQSRFASKLTNLGFDLLNKFLTYCPTKRISAEQALKHEFFQEAPRPTDPSMFPTWPAKSEQSHRTQSPKPPSGGKQFAGHNGNSDEERFHMSLPQEGKAAKGA
ncbi:CDK11B, partial [Cordylochernes scorpioides]